MKCDSNSFFNENIGSCFLCSNVCDDIKATGNSETNCQRLCPDYKPNPGSSQTSATNSGSNHLQIILPVICILPITLIIVYIIRKYHKRPPNQHIEPQALQPLKLTQEEVGDEDTDPIDSGIDTIIIDPTPRPTPHPTPHHSPNGSIDQEDDRDSVVSHQPENPTGLSEITCNGRYLKIASDASWCTNNIPEPQLEHLPNDLTTDDITSL